MCKLKIGFIGGGNMASALIGGLIEKLTIPANIHVVDPNQDALSRMENQFGVSTALSIDAALAQMDVIILSVKPQQMRDVIAALSPFLSGQLLLSIAAQDIMQAVGSTVWLDEESLIDAVTAVSGSGPAYVFYFIEAMQQAAIELGLNQEQGTHLAIATFNGAAQLALRSTEPVSVLRERVTSKGGTTYAALCSMEESGIQPAIVKAIKAAAIRGKELGDEFGDQN